MKQSLASARGADGVYRCARILAWSRRGSRAIRYRRAGIDPILWPRTAGSWPGYVFTGDPLRLPAVQFGLGHGSGAHAPDEYYVIDSTNPKISGLAGAVRSQVEFLYELASTT